MDKRYQVFVSSTFADLQDERQEVMQALLELDCMPAGMELFPAANEDQWTLIKKVIDDCDYYIVIVAGRYGSIGPDGISFTEMEYRYALSKNKPTIAFLHKEPGNLLASRSEQSLEGRKKLEEFRTLIQQKLCRFWDSPADLGSQVSRSLVKLIKAYPAVGWVKANLVPDTSTTEEILRLRNQVENLQSQLSEVSTAAPKGSEDLAQGTDKFGFQCEIEAYESNRGWFGIGIIVVDITWNEIFAHIGPLMIHESSEESLRNSLRSLAAARALEEASTMKQIKNYARISTKANMDGFHTIIVQLRALGLIAKSNKSRSVKDTATYWTLTPYGDNAMTRLRAIRREMDTSETV